MTKEEIISKVKALNLPKGSYVVFGSCSLAIAGIREANDIDLLVSPETLETLRKAGWRKIDKGHNDTPLVHSVFEAHDNWDFSPYSPTLAHLLTSADVVDDVPFASLEEVRKWKEASGGPKHLHDVELIDEHLRGNTSATEPAQ